MLSAGWIVQAPRDLGCYSPLFHETSIWKIISSSLVLSGVNEILNTPDLLAVKLSHAPANSDVVSETPYPCTRTVPLPTLETTSMFNSLPLLT